MAIWFKSFKSRNFWDKLNSWGKPLTMQLWGKVLIEVVLNQQCTAVFERFLFWFVIQPLWLCRSSLEMTFSHIKGFVADFFVYKKCYPRRYVGSMVAGRMEGKGELFFSQVLQPTPMQWVWNPMESFSSFYIKIEVSRNLNFIFMLAFQWKIITWTVTVGLCQQT